MVVTNILIIFAVGFLDPLHIALGLGAGAFMPSTARDLGWASVIVTVIASGLFIFAVATYEETHGKPMNGDWQLALWVGRIMTITVLYAAGSLLRRWWMQRA
ncbi:MULTISPECIES: hypothetical protein [Rhodomicrobium]|uniref:hypothetical protein n=1 Tax=Rhodomicrobium TaxID=1068 RepID=UPI000B4ADDA5|nr:MULTISPECIES: hypothetical protein [Rhodomicrobium]